MSTIIVYSSWSGNTKAIANYIANKTGGKAVDISDVKREDVESSDTIIIGSKIWANNISKKTKAFIVQNKDLLDSKNVSLFVCCGKKGQKADAMVSKIADSNKLSCKNKAFFNKGKKLVSTGEKIDDFISGL